MQTICQRSFSQIKDDLDYEALTVPSMPDSFYEKDFPLPGRKATKQREFNFEPDEKLTDSSAPAAAEQALEP